MQNRAAKLTWQTEHRLCCALTEAEGGRERLERARARQRQRVNRETGKDREIREKYTPPLLPPTNAQAPGAMDPKHKRTCTRSPRTLTHAVALGSAVADIQMLMRWLPV